MQVRKFYTFLLAKKFRGNETCKVSLSFSEICQARSASNVARISWKKLTVMEISVMNVITQQDKLLFMHS